MLYVAPCCPGTSLPLLFSPNSNFPTSCQLTATLGCLKRHSPNITYPKLDLWSLCAGVRTHTHTHIVPCLRWYNHHLPRCVDQPDPWQFPFVSSHIQSNTESYRLYFLNISETMHVSWIPPITTLVQVMIISHLTNNSLVVGFSTLNAAPPIYSLIYIFI